VSTIELSGLKAHHPLGFLAACGTLVACERTGNAARLAWTGTQEESRWTSRLDVRLDHGQDWLLSTLTNFAKSVGQAPALNWADGNKKTDRKIQKQLPGRFREAAKALELHRDTFARGRLDLDMFAAIGSDLALTKDGRLQPTPLDMTSASQGFLDEIKDLSASLASELKGRSKATGSREAFQEALFGPWQYRDDQHSLGWDPEAQRLHALRGKAPTNDTTRRSVRAAVFLASQALPLFPCFAVGGRLRTTGFHRYDDDDWFAWPIWTKPISLDTLRSLLAHPFSRDLSGRGVEIVYRCRRAHTGGSEGNYQVFSHPQERPWPVRRNQSGGQRGRR
jgi:hypothetical protein